MSEAMTWKQFRDMVTGMLTVDAKRVGISTFRDAILRQGVINIQQSIEKYRCNHESIYLPPDFVTEGGASRGTKPPQSIVNAVHMAELAEDVTTLSAPRGTRYACDPWPWNNRFALTSGSVSVNNGKALYCPDPAGYTFYIYPEVYDGWLVSIHWDGLKLEFDDEDETPFDEPMALAVAEFAKGKIAREVDHDLAMHDSYMKTFIYQKSKLYLQAVDERNLKS